MGRQKGGKCGNKEEDVIMRRSPRTSVRKVKMAGGGDGKEEKQDVKKSRKRKAVRYEDDPNYSDEEVIENESEQQKKVPGYRCSSLLLAELMGKLSSKQKGWVDNIGFTSLKKLIGSRPPKSLTMWLIDRVDTKKGTIEVCGEHIEIRTCVKRMLDLPSGEKKVPQPLNGRSKAKIPKLGSTTKGEKHSDHGRGQTAKDAMKILLAENEDEVSFCQSFVMLVLCIYLAPTTSLNINRSYYPAVMDVSQISLLDWCGFIADYLINGIEEYRSSKASHVQVPGCVHLLPLIYLDALIRHKALVFPPALALPDGAPMVHFVTTDHLSFLASADAYSNTKDRTEYGLLQDNMTRSQKCSAELVNGCDDLKTGEAKVPENVPASTDLLVHTEVLVDSLYKEIEDGRRQLFVEFQNKVKANDCRSFGLFKQKMLTLLAGYGKNNQACGGSAGVDCAFNAPGLAKTKDVGITFEKPGDWNGREKGQQCFSKGTEEEIHGPAGECSLNQDQNKNASLQLSAEQICSVVQAGAGNETAYYCMGTGDQAGKSKEGPLNQDEDNVCRFTDELADVVKIGMEAADEAACNVAEKECLVNGGSSLKLLTDAAISEGPPLYDDSPAVCTQWLNEASESRLSHMMETHENSSPRKIHSTDVSCILKKPVFDDSPGTKSIVPNLLLIGRDNLLTISETNQGSITRQLDGVSSRSSSQQTVSSSHVNSNHESVECIGNTADLSAAYDNDLEDTDGESKSSDIPEAADENECYYKNPLELTPGFVETPGYTNFTQELIDVELLPASALPDDVTGVTPLEKEIETGFQFKFGGSMRGSTLNLLGKITRLRSLEAGEEGTYKYKFVRPKDATETYKKHVTNSTVRISTRFRTVPDPERAKTKILIKGYHVTKGEFVDALKPLGEVCQSLMGLCSVAIMTDWETPKRLILDQATIDELMSDRESFDEMVVVRRLLKFQLEFVEEIFLPILHERHWILAVVDLVNDKVDLFDSLILVDEGTNPHEDLWRKVSLNLEFAYCLALKKTLPIVNFPCEYQKVKLQTNTHDCGFHVIQSMECYKSEDVVGHEKQKSLLPYRRYLSHVLVYHRFNELNPLREGVPEDIP